MGLRAKVALILAAAIIPISIGFSLWRIAAEHRGGTERRADRFAARLQQIPSGDCAAVKRFGDSANRRRPRRPAGFEPRFYSENLTPHGDAPRFPAKLREVLESDEPVHAWRLGPGPDLGVTAVRIAEEGACAIAVFAWRPDPVPPVVIRTAAAQTVGLAAILALLGMLVALPIVRRIRRLEDAVRRAHRNDFSVDLGGDDEINALADAFAETLAAVRAREKALEEYIGNTTHDLAIPLTVLQHRLRKLAAAHDSDDVRVALEESHYIAALIANMRASAKLETPDGLDLGHDVDLAEIVERVVGRHLPIAEQKGIELNYAVPDRPLAVRGEPTLVEQALSNLVQNAVQYNVRGGHVSVLLDTRGDGFELTVADDGPGIPEAVRARVLERGVRDDAARSRNEGGQGFGLAIVRRVAALHGWALELEHEGGLAVHLRG